MRRGVFRSTESFSRKADVRSPLLKASVLAALVLLLAGCGDEINSAARGYEKHIAGDLSAARKIWSAGADHGDDLSLYYLGRIHEVGDGVDQDYEKAVGYYRRSAQLGNPYALGSLAVLYAYGRGVPRDFVKSYAYSTLAADGYSRWSSDQRQAALRNRDLVVTRMTGADIVAAQKMADRLAERPAEAERD